jgi:AraC family transcriptional regulator
MSDRAEVEIQIIPETRVAFMRHVGPYASPGIADVGLRFRAWCQQHGLITPGRRMFGIAQDNPNITPSDRTRYDVGIQVDDGFQPRGDVGVQTIRGGRYACAPFTGTAGEIRAAWIRFLTRTLPDAGLEPDLAPAIEIYAAELVVDAKTDTFSCVLCMPLRSG